MRDIIKDAMTVLLKTWFVFFVIPFLSACGIFVYIWKFQNNFSVIEDAIDPIGIFAAFMFTLIFIVVEHFLKRKEAYSTLNEEDRRYIDNYRRFTRSSVALITFSILLAGGIIVLQIVFSQISISSVILNAAINAIFSFCLVQYAVMVLLIIKEMYAMLTEDIESK